MVLAVLLIGFLLSGVWFGCHMLVYMLMNKTKLKELLTIQPFISSIIPTVIICAVTKIYPFNFESLVDYKLWIIGLVTVLVTSIIIVLGVKKEKKTVSGELFKMCIEASCMEIPQRVMMQTFVMAWLCMWGQNPLWCIVVNGIIWCLDQVVQVIIFKNFKCREFVVENLASFVFSIGIGYVFYVSGCFVIPMICHGLERFITCVKFDRER